MRQKTLRMAQVLATAVEVICPWCSEPQPNPDDGSHLWAPEQLARVSQNGWTKRECVSCEEVLILSAPPTAQMNY